MTPFFPEPLTSVRLILESFANFLAAGETRSEFNSIYSMSNWSMSLLGDG